MRHTPGKRWRHIIINAHCTWLHGDPRGFRDRGHRKHSSGDYRSPPPSIEHINLREYFIARSGPPIRIPNRCLPAIGEAIRANLLKQEHYVAAVAVNPVHCHFLVQLPDNVGVIKKTVGWCKFFATRAAREVDPKLESVNLWAEGETYKPVDDASHFDAAKRYIAERQGSDAWVYRDR